MDDTATETHHRVVIVGAGFSGLGAAIRLKRDGVEDFVILERADDLGGTWRDNTYPGCACDVPSHLYSFSFAPNPDWSRTFSGGGEIWQYLRVTARGHRVEERIRYGHEVTGARWDEAAQLWRIETTDGRFTSEFLVAAAGPLADPKLPDIPGVERFEGRVFHSARWDHEHPLDGERVGVIGTGASSIQLVPAIQPRVGSLAVFQRTAPWVVGSRDRAISPLERRIYRAAPPAQRLMRAAIYWARELFVLSFMHPREGSPGERMARRHLEREVADPALRARLEPRYRMGCKRVLISDTYYAALQAPNVELVTDPIAEITARGIRTEGGEERELDTIVLGTGFHVTDKADATWVRDAQGRSLEDRWRGSPQAYLGSYVAGFPNLFMMVGPNTGLGHNSIVFMIESQLNTLIDGLRHLDRHGLGVWDVREEVQARYNAILQRRLRNTVWNTGGCQSWYLDRTGRNSSIWPGFTWPFRRRTRHFRPQEFHLAPRRAPAPAPAAAPAAGGGAGGAGAPRGALVPAEAP
ncbi:MAG: NAD(P)/FAD-dependent oxidoreductase [Solirubrobacterales bacterium]|nr:NAD(P)/FAD-dependent oxidoreductase [Solirubrobacterales bacterium]